MTESPFEALLPREMAAKAEQIGVRKAETPALTVMALAVLAGAFIAMGAIFSTTVLAGSTGSLPYGVARLLAGLVFSLGLILVVVGGAELFTGNVLIVMAWASGKVTGRALLRNWVIAYIGNFVGAFGSAVLVFLGQQYTAGGGGVGQTALRIAAGKVDLGFIQAVALGILCNALVCMAVWLTYSARSTTDKIAAIIFPISAFVASGFEHSVANMYFVPYGLLISAFDPAFVAGSGVDMSGVSWFTFLWKNLVPVTLGNIIGGALLVASMYWAIFLRRKEG
jgi:formate/nitrite transporter